MISKRVRRDKATSSFGRLGRYVLSAKSDNADILWARTADYVMDTKGEGEKLASFRITNCAADTPGMAIAEVQATQAKNTRSKADKTYHLIVSFPDGERPTPAQLEDIEDTLCAALGFSEHQRISAVHINTENLHIHIAVNKVHPRTLRCVEPYNDYYTRDRVCRELERKHGLSVDNGLTRPADGQAVPSPRAAELEAHQGEASFLTWVKETAGAALMEARDTATGWQELHQVAARHGLQIKKHGAGLVIAQRDGPLSVKASSVNRGLSIGALTARLGNFQPPQVRVHQSADPPPASPFKKAPLQRTPGTEQLYSDYAQRRRAADAVRDQARTAHRAQVRRDAEALRDWYRTRRAEITARYRYAGSQGKKEHRALAAEYRAEMTRRGQQNRQKMAQITEQHRMPTWHAFLQEAAAAGDQVALAALRSRDNRRTRMAHALLTAANAEEARAVVFPHLRPRALRNGALVYRVEDGGVVSDEARQVRVTEVTAGASFLALALAAERFAGRPLAVEGTAEFKDHVARLAAIQGLQVRFADPALEGARTRHVEANRSIMVANDQETPALRAYIGARNRYRAWAPDDAGPVVVHAVDRLTDGQPIAVLSKGAERLVKPITPAQAEALKGRAGQSVAFDRQGNIREARGQTR